MDAMDKMMNAMRKDREIQESLAGWAEQFAQMTPDEIADFLKANGVTAVPGDTQSCALARFLTKELGTTIAVGPHNPNNPSVVVPPSVQGFIDNFDDGKYPEISTNEKIVHPRRGVNLLEEFLRNLANVPDQFDPNKG